MPELPEVETIRTALAPHLTDRVIIQVDVRESRLRRPVQKHFIKNESCGRKVCNVRRRGKFLVIELEDLRAIVLHLGMTGSLRMEPNNFTPRKHDHVVWALDDGQAMVFNDARRFGVADLQILPCPGGDPPSLAPMGPEPLGEMFTAAYAFASSKNRTQPVKNLLLDQHFVAGIGNIYASEALWRTGISPRRKARNIGYAKWERLVTQIKAVLKHAIAAGGTTIRDYRTVDGTEGQFTACLDVYDREAMPCKRCGDSQRIRRIVMAGRSTYYCPGCQR